nr:RNA pyrophosphohydrolase [Ferrimonas balearica]
MLLFAAAYPLWNNRNKLGIQPDERVIDNDGFRANVGIIICNRQGQVLWARRFGQHSWQFPQGGVNEGESPEQTMFRELYEEVGLKKEDVRILARSRSWLRYRLPKRLVRQDSKPLCIGQKQKWFLLQLTAKESQINLSACGRPEFDDWRWVSYWYPVRQVVSFKRDVYRKVMKEFAPVVLPMQAGEKQQERSNQPRHRRRRRKR